MQTRKRVLRGLGVAILGGSVKQSLATGVRDPKRDVSRLGRAPTGKIMPVGTRTQIDLTAPVDAKVKEVVFRTALKPGKMKLQIWLTAQDGTSHGAYFVYVSRLP